MYLTAFLTNYLTLVSIHLTLERNFHLLSASVARLHVRVISSPLQLYILSPKDLFRILSNHVLCTNFLVSEMNVYLNYFHHPIKQYVLGEGGGAGAGARAGAGGGVFT